MRLVLWFIVVGMMAGIVLPMMGCASDMMTITYHSDPEGAVLYEGAKRWGYTPFIGKYVITREHKRQGYIDVKGPEVHWASGAVASVPALRAYLDANNNGQFTFVRPENFPGREIDAQFALELEKLILMRQQLKAQQQRAYSDQQRAYWAQQQAYYDQQIEMWNNLFLSNMQKGMHCTSRIIGNFIYTNCY